MLNGLLNHLPERKQKQNPTAPVFVHPILIPEDFKNTIANYNQHIYKYNMQLWIDQAEIRKYNKEVIRSRKNAGISVEQKIKEQVWKEMMKDHTPEEFNEAVEEYNMKHGLQLRKKNLLQPVKPETEKYFIALLYQYNAQLYLRKKNRVQLEVHVPGELPKVEIYPNKIIEAERNGVKCLPVTVESVRHHRERLEEAGVLTGYSYHGPNRPVKIAFNPDILSITDNGSPKNTHTDNQTLTQSQTNKVPHNNVSSRNTINKFQYREKEGDSRNCESSSSCTKETTKTPERQDGKKSGAPNNPDGDLQKKFTGGREFMAEKNELSAVLMDHIADKMELSRDLAAGKHKNYQPVGAEIAQNEAYLGAMHPEDFKELAIQDVFKFSASLFSDIDAHPGSWMNAYKYWLADSFHSFTGKTFSKTNLLPKWQKCIEVLREVKKYKKAHPGWQPAFPSLYFDPARTFKENNSFEYALRFFRLDEEKTDSFQKRKINAGKSARHKTDVQKAREKIRLMIAGKISLDRVYEFVGQNCSKKVNDGLNALIKKEFAILEKNK
jgi:hypothetical protein